MSTIYTNIPPEMSDSGGGVSTLNTLTGDVVLVAGSGISITPAGNNLTIATTGGAAITALTGDGTATGPGSVPFTLATVNAGVGSFGTASNVSSITVNAKGLITAAANTPIQITEAQVTNLVSDLAGKQATGNYIIALTGDATASGPGSVAITLSTVNGNVGSFGTASNVSTFTVNAKGLITAASNTPIQITEAQVTNLTTDLATFVVGPASSIDKAIVRFNGTTGKLVADSTVPINTLTANSLFVGMTPNAGITGTFNVGFGTSGFAATTTGIGNLIIGANGAGNLHTTGNFNQIIGYGAASALTTGGSSVYIGANAGLSVTTGTSNVYIGQQSGNFNTASSNIFIGLQTGFGASGTSTGGSNVGIGNTALTALTSGTNNIVIGVNSGNHITSGINNVIVGASSGQAITTGGGNVIIGVAAGGSITTVSNNTIIGSSAGGNLTTGGNNIALGNGSAVSFTSATATQELIVGGGGIATTIGYFGKGGLPTATPTAFTFATTSASGTNIAGSNLILSGGRSTGSAAGGSVLIQTSPADGSGSALNALVTAATFNSAGNLTVLGTISGSNLSGTNTGDQTITLTGGVTGSGTGSFAATVVSVGGASAASVASAAAGLFASDLKLTVAGNGFYVKEGTNATMGVSTLVAGTVTVSTTKVTANSRIFLTAQTSSGVPGFVGISARSAGTSFTITSSNVLDTSDIAWIIIEPA